MNIDNDLMQYCIDKDFPVNEMDARQFKMVENTAGFNFYKLGIIFKALGKDILKALEKIEHRKKSCKNFKCK